VSSNKLAPRGQSTDVTVRRSVPPEIRSEVREAAIACAVLVIASACCIERHSGPQHSWCVLEAGPLELPQASDQALVDCASHCSSSLGPAARLAVAEPKSLFPSSRSVFGQLLVR